MVCHQWIHIFREGYTLLFWELSSLWVFMHEDRRFSVLLPGRFASKLRRKRAHHTNDVPPLTGKQWTPLVLGAEDSPDVTGRCAEQLKHPAHILGVFAILAPVGLRASACQRSLVNR